MWQEYIMKDHCHCPEYENLTMEEKLLVNIELRNWFANRNLIDSCLPIFIFREAEFRIIERLKEEEWRRKNLKHSC